MNKKQYSYIFWDWNGTIIDDVIVNYDIINSLLVEHGKNNISLPEYRKAFSFPIKDFYQCIGLPVNGKEYEQLVHNYWYLYKSKIKQIPLMVGAYPVLSRLKENGIKQYILSASDKKMIFEQISIYGIQDCFEEIIAPQDGYAQGKTELAKQWLSNQNICVDNVIMIGDTLHDYETAKAINIDCALINRGHQDLKNCKHDSTTLVYDNLIELSDCVFT